MHKGITSTVVDLSAHYGHAYIIMNRRPSEISTLLPKHVLFFLRVFYRFFKEVFLYIYCQLTPHSPTGMAGVLKRSATRRTLAS